MTDLAIRQAVAEITTSITSVGTVNNPVATTFYERLDRIAFESTPALVLVSPDSRERFMTLGAANMRADVKVEVEYLDAPVIGDDQEASMATVEAWFENARKNLRHNPTGDVGFGASWLELLEMRTLIDKPLIDHGRVFYHGCLYLTVRSVIRVT